VIMVDALLVIDVQNGFINNHTKHIVVKIRKLLETQWFDFIVFFKFVNNLDSNFTKVINYHGLMPMVLRSNYKVERNV